MGYTVANDGTPVALIGALLLAVGVGTGFTIVVVVVVVFVVVDGSVVVVAPTNKPL